MIFLISQNSLADVIFVTKDQKVPYDGYLFDLSSATEARNAAIDRDRYHLLSDSLLRSVDLQANTIQLQEKRVELYKTSSDELSKKLYEASSMSSWEKIGIFVLGVATTVGAGYAISKVAR